MSAGHPGNAGPTTIGGELLPWHFRGTGWQARLSPSGATNPPASVREGIARCWVAALREAVGETETRGPEQDLFDRAPHGLRLDYRMYFQSRRLRDITPTFLSLLLPKRVGNILLPRGAPPSARPCESQQEQAPDSEGTTEFQPARASTPEELPNRLLEWESILKGPPSFIPEEDEGSSSGPKKESHPVLKVKLPFPQKAQKAAETLEEESTAPKDAPSEDGEEVVTISDEDGMSQEAPDPSTSQSTGVLSRKWHLEGQDSVLYP